MHSGEGSVRATQGIGFHAVQSAARPDLARLLVADNGLESVARLAQLFGHAGYAVRTAISADAAILEARQGIDVAVIDLRLPNDRAIELVVALRKLQPAPEIVLLTGAATRETASAALKLGAFDYLIRPCNDAQLLDAVAKAKWQARLNAEKQARAYSSGSAVAQASSFWRAASDAAAPELESESHRALRGDLRRNAHLNNELAMLELPREPASRPVACNAIIDAALELIQADAARLRVSIEQDLSPDLPPVAGDRDQLKTALVNLLVNALDATPSGGRIRVSARADRGNVLLAVDDSGAGIPFGLRSRVFDSSFSSKRQGTGLGLAMISAIAKAHRGRVVLEESKLGGTRFVLQLPAMSPPAPW